MKKLVVLLLLFFVCQISFSQIREHTFDSYMIKQTGLNYNQPQGIFAPFEIQDLDKGIYFIKVYLTPSVFFQTTAKFDKQYDFAGQMIYEYRGGGTFNNILNNFLISSTVKLSDLTKGMGYDRERGDDMKDYEVHFFYWYLDSEEPLLKDNFYIYPIKNKKM